MANINESIVKLGCSSGSYVTVNRGEFQFCAKDVTLCSNTGNFPSFCFITQMRYKLGGDEQIMKGTALDVD